MPFSLIVPPRPPAYPSELPRTPPVDYRVISVVEFPREGYKIRKVFAYKSIFQKETILYFVNWCSSELSKSSKIWLSKSIFYVKNAADLSIFFVEEYQFRCSFFVIGIFWRLQFTVLWITLNIALLENSTTYSRSNIT